jgi:purine-nucleoside phosphorylase
MTFHGLSVPAPQVGIVLGSGLGGFAEQLEGALSIPYGKLPGWPQATAVGHAGQLVFGQVEGVGVVVMSGRFHLYEGYSAAQVTHGVREMHRLGIRSLILTNAAGGIDLSYSRGALVLISDHINLQGVNPLTGPNDNALGPRFPDMSHIYPAALRQLARKEAARLGFSMPEGVYAGLSGPSYETPAEIRYLRAIGAQLVGMSTVCEAILASYLGISCLGISTVTNMAAGMNEEKINHEEVLETGRAVRSRLVQLLRGVIPRLI